MTVELEETEGLPSCMKVSPTTTTGDLGYRAGGLLTNLGEEMKARKRKESRRLPHITLEEVSGKL